MEKEQPATSVAAASSNDQFDLVGGPFAVIESDPGVQFTKFLMVAI
jgi:hypothetical protein